MFLSEEIVLTINTRLGKLLSVKPVAGGSINQCYQITTQRGMFFLKTNAADRFPGLFLSETEGLKKIRETGTIEVPGVISHGRAGQEVFLILDWIETGRQDFGFYRMGNQVARMHKHSAGKFGLEHDNYMGSLSQKNEWHTTWDEFFINERLEPQFKIALNNRLIYRIIRIEFENFLTKLQSMYPAEPPALVHGDLWSGNYIIGSNGNAYLIDPAVYYGHREVDIAMSTLFGGFAPEFYEGYTDEFPLEQGWKDRLEIWNLYPLLIHLNLFGPAYLNPIRAILKKFG